jgi:hypothetical protein
MDLLYLNQKLRAAPHSCPGEGSRSESRLH